MATLLKTDSALNASSNTYTLDPAVGGFNGLMPDYANWANATPFVRPRLMAVLMQEPSGMQYFSDGTDRIAFMKSIIEVLPKSITGLNRSVTVEYMEAPASSNSDMFEAPTNSTRQRSVPNFTWDELKGKPITNFHDQWISYLIMDTILKQPRIISEDSYISAGSPAITADFRSAVVMFVEPNMEMTGVNTCYLCANFQPKGFTDESSRQASGALTGLEQSIEFTSTTIDNGAAMKVALAYINSINKSGLAPQALAPFVSGRSNNTADDAAPLGATYQSSQIASSL